VQAKQAMALINPPMTFNGNAGEAFRFYLSVFGGFATIGRCNDMPASGQTITANEGEKIMHAALLNGGNILRGNDVPQFRGGVNERERRSRISINRLRQVKPDRRLFTRPVEIKATITSPINQSTWQSKSLSTWP
jgi:PhnB protein